MGMWGCEIYQPPPERLLTLLPLLYPHRSYPLDAISFSCQWWREYVERYTKKGQGNGPCPQRIFKWLTNGSTSILYQTGHSCMASELKHCGSEERIPLWGEVFQEALQLGAKF